MTPHPTAEPRIFSAAYYDRLRDVEDRHWWARGMREIEERILRAHRNPGPLDVLDAGCGTGAALVWLRRIAAGGTVSAIDLAPEAVAHCRLRGEHEVREGSVLDLPWPDASFDLVHSADVLQHLPVAGGPARALAEAHRVLRPGGSILVRTNARPSGGLCAGPDYQRFDGPALRRLLEQAGFAVERLTYVNFLPSLLAEARERLRPQRPAGDHGLRVRPYAPALGWLDRALGAVLAAEARYLARPGRSLPFGHTTIAVARRQRSGLPAP